MRVIDHNKTIVDMIKCLWQFNMQISAAILESIFHVISANIAHNCTKKVSRPMFSGTIFELTTCVSGMLRKF